MATSRAMANLYEDHAKLTSKYVHACAHGHEAIQIAAQGDDVEELHQLAHWLAGSAGTLGFPDFTETAQQLESSDPCGAPEETQELVDKIQALANRISPPVT